MVNPRIRQAFDQPAACLVAVAEAVVQPVLALLPELDLLGRDPVTAPVMRALDVASLEALGHFLHPAPQRLAAVDHAALVRCPGAELGLAGAAGEVEVGVGFAEPRNRAGDANLPSDRPPPEGERGARVLLEVGRLGAAVVGEEVEALRAESLEQDHPHRRPPVPISCRKAHRLGQRHRLLGRREPCGELLDRVVRQLFAVQRALEGGHQPPARARSSRPAQASSSQPRW
jgi:hypothetical protein